MTPARIVFVVFCLSPARCAFIHMANKAVKCVVSPGLQNLSRISIYQLPDYQQGLLHRNSTENEMPHTLILDSYHPHEIPVLELAVLKASSRVAFLETRCPTLDGVGHYCVSYMLAQRRPGRLIWIKPVVEGEVEFRGFYQHWMKVRLYVDHSRNWLILQACNFQPVWLAVSNGSSSRSSLLKCNRLGVGGQLRSRACNSRVTFARLATRVHRGRISYPNKNVRLFALKLAIAAACTYVYFFGVNGLLKKVVK